MPSVQAGTVSKKQAQVMLGYQMVFLVGSSVLRRASQRRQTEILKKVLERLTTLKEEILRLFLSLRDAGKAKSIGSRR